MPAVVAAVTSSGFRALSRARGARIFHPRGVAFDARWVPLRPGVLMPGAALGAVERPAVVRLSRALGITDGPSPDILGLAVKVLDAHGHGQDQDLLFASVGRGTATSRILVPQRRFDGVRYSTLLPYDLGGHRSALWAESSSREVPLRYREVRYGASVSLDVHVVAAIGGEIATLHIGDRLPQPVADLLRFDPWHTGPELQPVGSLNELRRPTYQASQEGRDAPAEDTRGGVRP